MGKDTLNYLLAAAVNPDITKVFTVADLPKEL